MFMALHRQGNGSLGTAFSLQGHGAGDQKFSNGGRLGTSSRGIEIPSRGAMKPARAKRFGRTSRGSQYGIGLFLFLLLCVVSFTILGGDYLFSAGRLGKDRRKEDHVSSIWNGFDDHNDKALNFGKDSIGMEDFLAKDSRDWDKDDRIRHNYMDYNEDLHSFDRNVGNTDIGADAEFDSERQLAANAQDLALKHRKDGSKIHVSEESDDVDASERQVEKESGQRETPKEVIGGWYNEGGRKELRMYEEQYEALLKQELDSSSKEHDLGFASGQGNKGGEDKPRSGAKGGFGNDFTDKVKDDQANMLKTGKNNNAIDEGDDDDDYDDHGDEDEFLDEFDVEYDHASKRTQDENTPEVLNVTSEQSLRYSNRQKDFEDILSQTISSSQQDSRSTEKSSNEKSMQEDISKGRLQKVEKRRTVRRRSSRRTRRRRRAGSSCDVTFRNSTRGLREPENSKISRFSLSYIDTEERPHGSNIWEPRFAGHQTLSEREESFKARDQTIHCGFVQGSNGPSSTGFDLAEDDVRFLSKCHIAVSSCIFANSDHIRSPRGKKFTGTFKKEVCFVMFVDQRTLDVMIEEGEAPDQRGFYGSWKVVVVRNLPYSDARRTGKVPKFLTHRLFPSARYSIWLDSKLRLQSDPVLLLEYFLWRGGYEYAISNHYDRHCVWEEVQQNKRLNKFNHSIIDEQFAFYRADGLTKFNASDPKKLLPSHVPEGSFIVRAHTPMSNLFSCLWFNEVDRFTPRDQLSFAYTYLKLVRMNPDKSFYLNMFKDCERKGIAKLFRHRRNVTRLLQR